MLVPFSVFPNALAMPQSPLTTTFVHPRHITNKATAIYECYWAFISVWETLSEQSRIYY